MNIHTPASLRAKSRQLDRRRRRAARVITAMSRGASLNLTFMRNGSAFTLSDGTPVSSEIALMVVNDIRVVSVNDGLFPTTPQTWRYIEL